MNLSRTHRNDPQSPFTVSDLLADRAPGAVTAIGNRQLLQERTLALFCSTQCPGPLVQETYDLAQALRTCDVVVTGGFHSPMEQECLALLLRGPAPVIVCPARCIEGMRIPDPWRKPLDDGRLLVLSCFGEKDGRITRETAQRRNEFVASLVDEVFVAHAAPGSKTESFCRILRGWGKSLLTLESPLNAALRALGATSIAPRDAHGRWGTRAEPPRPLL